MVRGKVGRGGGGCSLTTGTYSATRIRLSSQSVLTDGAY